MNMNIPRLTTAVFCFSWLIKRNLMIVLCKNTFKYVFCTVFVSVLSATVRLKSYYRCEATCIPIFCFFLAAWIDFYFWVVIPELEGSVPHCSN